MDELLKVVKIDVSQGTQSVKEYAETLFQAQESAANLNSELETVQNTANKEVKNDFLAGLSDGIDDVAKKFNGDYKPAVEALIKQMGELNGETIEFSSSIDDINGKQLKADFLAGVSDGIDDVVKQFNGDYKPAVESIIQKMKDLNEATEDLGDTVTDDLTPDIKEAAEALDETGKKGNSAFKLITNAIGLTPLGKYVEDLNRVKRILNEAGIVGAAGFNKIKLAIAGTGIGLIIVAVGTLIARFDDLKKAVGITDKTMQDFKKDGISALSSIAGAVVALGSSIATGIVGGIKLAWNGVKNYGGLILDTFKSIGQAIMNPTEAGKVFDNYKNSIKQRFSDLGKEVSNLSKSVSEQWAKGMQAGKNLVTNYFAPDPDEAEAKAKEAVARVNAVKNQASSSTGSGSTSSPELDRSSLDNELKEIEERTKYQKQWIEGSLLSEEEKKQKVFELEQQSYQERLDAYNQFMQERQLTKEENDAFEEEMDKIKNQAMLEDYTYTNEQIRQAEEDERARKEEQRILDEEQLQAEREAAIEQAETEISDNRFLADQKYSIDIDYYNKRIQLLKKQLIEENLTEKEREKINKQLEASEKTLTETEKKQNNLRLSNKKYLNKELLKSSSSLFSATADLLGKETAAGKAAAIADATISTYSSAQGAFERWMTSGVPAPWSTVMAYTEAAAAIIAGIGRVKQIIDVDEKGETTTPSASSSGAPATSTAPTTVSAIPAQIGVTPMLDELRDLTSMQTLPVNGENAQRVYVVESDITEVGNRVEVRDSEATF